ncbi:hypothetical protein J5N97_004027 [Dioscorea zingiberensis]|uniref:Protein kinase domain-containing protein n=1 Tax=Dioscorea zingiberensis TaxID=325984 RepID=A0A9D5D5D2_9LILI|nr:hypothetical protein J5N97_004027 [Dioscorea zingiberensis]
MQPRKAKILAGATFTGVLILILVLWLCLGPSKTFFLLGGIGVAVILSVLLWVLLQHAALDRRRMSLVRRSALEGNELRLEYSFLRKVAGLPTKFRYKDLVAATDHFQALLGRGASGSVFKGILEDGTPVAVKRIEGAEHGDHEFRSEVSAVASVQHVNLVRLLGYCLNPGGPRFLVYEYIHNGSLASWIFPSDRSSGSSERRCLPWPLRYGIAVDVAKALAYLHHDCRSRVLHMDIKPENILLDEGFRALVSDFGLSKLMGRDQSRIVTTIRGTKGYLAPEWFLENGISEKSDIYSYGMVLLELVGGRRNVMLVGDGEPSERQWSYFPKIVAEKLREGKTMQVVDERLLQPQGGGGGGGGVDERQVKTLVYVALWCIQENPKLRPSMARVVDMLEGRLPVDTPPETEMIIVDILSINDRPGAGPGAGPAGAGIGSMNYSFAASILSGR